MDRNEFQQLFSKRTQDIRDNIEGLYISMGRSILKRPPFCYSDKMADEVATGVVRHGDLLMSNATLDSDDDEEDENEEINNLGDEMAAHVNSTALRVSLDDNRRPDDTFAKSNNLYPSPDPDYVRTTSASVFGQALQQIRDYVHGEGSRGFSASVLLGDACNEDGLVFKNGQIVPMEIVQEQVKKILNERGLSMAPMAVDLVMDNYDDEGIRVVSVQDKGIETYVVKP